MIIKNVLIIIFTIFISVLMAAEANTNNQGEQQLNSYYDLEQSNSSTRAGIGQFGFPSNPMNDRAKGYLLKGVVKNAITNYGNFITWDEHPAGLWGEYSYLPNVSMIAGVPGQKYSYKFEWYKVSNNTVPGLSSNFSEAPDDWDEGITLSQDWNDAYGQNVVVFCSEDAYDAWAPAPDGSGGNYVDIVFDAENDRGILGERVENLEIDVPNHYAITSGYQWTIMQDFSDNLICIGVDYGFEIDDPNKSNAMIGLVYPWAKRPVLIERLDEFDYYDYGEDQEAWSEDDNYVYYGANVAESWFSRYNPSTNVDWHASDKARENTHNTEVSAGDLFGDTPFSDSGDSYPLLAHSSYSNTWPESFNVETGAFEVEWPGWYAQDYDPEGTGCFPVSKKNDDCWIEVPGRFISDNDVYMEFDDRWAHRGNTLNSSGQYEQTGYPMGIKVSSMAHSYGVSYAEDIMFVTVKIKNESDDMVMPDGTKLNNGLGFDYKDMSFGFYMDADVLSTDLYGNFNVHTNGDDFMEYYYDVIEIPSSDGDGSTERMLISMALVGDYDGISGQTAGYSMDDSDQDPGNDFGIVAVQLLDSPLATENLDFDQDGIVDVYIGEKMKMTDWHWFDWYNRPGVVYREGSGGCCAGDPGRAQALNKEEIQYKIMVGDTTNLSTDEKEWYFHADPTLDQLDPNFNPHFDNVDDLKQTTLFSDDEEGLDCVLEMTSGPFDLDVGEETLFSFCIIFGQNKEDLIANAEFAQIMYNNKYQGYTPPKRPKVVTSYDHNQISLHWNQDAEFDKDVVTGYTDFEGYKIYKSTDGGVTWGDSEDIIYDNNGIQVGWRPVAQFDLTQQQDIDYCVDMEYLDEDNNENWDYNDCIEDKKSSDICSFVLDDFGQYKDIESESDCVSAGMANGTCDAGEPFIDSNENGQWDEGEEFTDMLECVWVKDSSSIASEKCQQICDPWDYIECKDVEVDGVNCENCTRDIDVSGADVHAPWFQLGSNSGFHAIKTHTPHVDANGDFYQYTYTDDNVLDGIVYTYAVTAYDMGVAPSYGVEWVSFESGFAPDTLATQANPSGFSSPNGYQYIENSRGTTILDDNFVQVSPGYRGDYNVEDVYVYPNPYIVSSGFNNETEYQSRIRFTKVPYNEETNEGSTITIYTITGEKVYSWQSLEVPPGNDPSVAPGEDNYNTWWDLRTVNNQEVAPGLYLYTVEHDGKTFVGKFAVVK